MRYKKVNEKQTSNALIMIFGATGDLANRKLFPSPGYLPNPRVKPRSPTLQVDSLPFEPPGKLPR